MGNFNCFLRFRACLQLIADRPPAIEEELDLITALTQLDDFGVHILPLQGILKDICRRLQVWHVCIAVLSNTCLITDHPSKHLPGSLIRSVTFPDCFFSPPSTPHSAYIWKFLLLLWTQSICIPTPCLKWFPATLFLCVQGNSPARINWFGPRLPHLGREVLLAALTSALFLLCSCQAELLALKCRDRESHKPPSASLRKKAGEHFGGNWKWKRKWIRQETL